MRPGPRQGQARAVNRHCRVCGEWHDNAGRRFCDAHIPRCACGEPAEPKRSQCVKCLNDWRRTSPTKQRSKPCETCGLDMLGFPSVLATKRWCSVECRPKVERSTTPCVVCAKPCVDRKTCSDECFAALLKSRATFGVRTPEQRKKRRAQERAKYRRKDKAEVVARLTSMQRGRCASCKLAKPLVLDHCHATGDARAMLCVQCNAALGLLGESPDRIAALHAYAKTWAQRRLVAV